MREKLEPAIEALQQELAEQERAVNETKKLINRLCEKAGMSPMYQDTDTTAGAAITAIRGDTFYGDPSVATSARRYLEMRKAANRGPATTRDIYDALKLGGFPFETSDANNAMTGIRQVLRKNSSMFHRLPNNEWGLRSWYDRIRPSKPSDETGDDDEPSDTKAAAPKKKTAASELRKPRAAPHQGQRPGSVQQPPERKEEPDVVHQPEVKGPVTGQEAA